MNSISDLHSQRPEYQKEMIDFSLLKMEELLSGLGVNYKFYDPNNIYISFLDLGKDGSGNYDIGTDRTNIDFRSSFNISVYLHEFAHAYSSSDRRKHIIIPGYTVGFTSYSGKSFSAINEGITEGITQYIISRNRDKIEQIEKKYRNLRIRYRNAGIASSDKNAKNGYTNYGETESYISEQLLLNALINLLAYHFSQKKNSKDFDTVIKIVWRKIMYFYFSRDRKAFYYLVREIDSDGKIWKGLKVSKPYDTSVESTVDAISEKIQKLYESGYEPSLDIEKLL